MAASAGPRGEPVHRMRSPYFYDLKKDKNPLLFHHLSQRLYVEK
jgi:hypothetical protein